MDFGVISVRCLSLHLNAFIVSVRKKEYSTFTAIFWKQHFLNGVIS